MVRAGRYYRYYHDIVTGIVWIVVCVVAFSVLTSCATYVPMRTVIEPVVVPTETIGAENGNGESGPK